LKGFSDPLQWMTLSPKVCHIQADCSRSRVTLPTDSAFLGFFINQRHHRERCNHQSCQQHWQQSHYYQRSQDHLCVTELHRSSDAITVTSLLRETVTSLTVGAVASAVWVRQHRQPYHSWDDHQPASVRQHHQPHHSWDDLQPQTDAP